MKMKDWIVPIVFLALPFAILTPGVIWTSQLLFFLICPMLVVALNLRNPWVKWFLLYVFLWQLIVFLICFNNRHFSPGPGLSILMGCMSGAILYKFVSEGALPLEKWKSVIRAAVLIQIFCSIPQPLGINPIMMLIGLLTQVQEKLPGHLVGTLGNRNYLAAFIAMSIPFFSGWRTFKVKGITINLSLILIFIFLGACLSPGTLAAIIGITFLWSYDWPWKQRVIAMSLSVKVAVGFAAAYVLTTGYHLNEFQALPGQLREFLSTGKVTVDPFLQDIGRFAMWMTALSKLISSGWMMVFGSGPAAFWGKPYPIHSQYISVWFQFGLIGLVMMLGYLIQAGKFLIQSRKPILLSALLILCLDMVGNFPLEIATTSFMAIIIGGLIERERLKAIDARASLKKEAL